MSKESKDKTPQIYTHTPARSKHIYIVLYTQTPLLLYHYPVEKNIDLGNEKTSTSGDNLAICDESEPKPGGLKMGPAGLRKMLEGSSQSLGGGNSKIFYFHPENWGRFPF